VWHYPHGVLNVTFHLPRAQSRGNRLTLHRVCLGDGNDPAYVVNVREIYRRWTRDVVFNQESRQFSILVIATAQLSVTSVVKLFTVNVLG